MFAATHTVDKSSPDCLPKQKLSTCFELGNNSCNSTPDKDVFSLAGARPNTNPTRDALEATHIHIPREVKMSQIADAMAYFIELIQNHLRYAGEGFDFNYESVAVEGFQHKGRGAVSIDISELVEPYINRENRCVEFLEKYVPLHTVSSSQEEEEESKQLAKVFQELVGAYNPETEYVVQLVIDSAKLPPTIPWDFPNKLLISVVVLDRTIGRKPTPLKKEQIRKRLR
jgi:hypothetical protein